MRRGTKKLVLAAVCLGVLLAVALTFWIGWERRDPLVVLSRKVGAVHVVSDSAHAFVTPAGEVRSHTDLTLLADEAGVVELALSLPADLGAGERIPVLLILGGLESGRKNLRYVSLHGRNALIGYEYPYNERRWYQNTAIREIPRIRHAVRIVPSQFLAVFKWLRRQTWVDEDRIHLLGYSFGALFVPGVQRVLEAHGYQIKTSTLAFGGVDLTTLCRHNLDWGNGLARQLVSSLLMVPLYPMEPALHLPHLRSDLLIINAKHDEVVPFECALELQRLAPEPKTIVNLEVEHLDPRRPELTEQVVNLNREWLLERHVLNP